MVLSNLNLNVVNKDVNSQNINLVKPSQEKIIEASSIFSSKETDKVEGKEVNELNLDLKTNSAEKVLEIKTKNQQILEEVVEKTMATMKDDILIKTIMGALNKNTLNESNSISISERAINGGNISAGSSIGSGVMTIEFNLRDMVKSIGEIGGKSVSNFDVINLCNTATINIEEDLFKAVVSKYLNAKDHFPRIKALKPGEFIVLEYDKFKKIIDIPVLTAKKHGNGDVTVYFAKESANFTIKFTSEELGEVNTLNKSASLAKVSINIKPTSKKL